MTAELLWEVAALAAPAALPTLTVVGARVEAAPLLLPVGALISAAGSYAAVVTETPFAPWWIGVAVLVNVVAAGLLASGGRLVRVPLLEHRLRRPSQILPALAAVAGAVVGLQALSRHDVDWDARSIWFLHSRLLMAGGDTYRSALHSPAYAFSHVDYPTLTSSAVAAAWTSGGGINYRHAQILVALIAASLLVCLACLVARCASRGWPTALAVVVAFGLVVAAYGVAGVGSVNGYSDLTAAAAAAAAATALLVLPLRRDTVSIGVLCCWVAGSTKQEGLVAALIVALLFAARLFMGRRIRGSAKAAAVTMLPLLFWPAFVAVAAGSATSGFSGTSADRVTESRSSRLHLAWPAMVGQFRFLIAFVVVALVAAALLGRARSRRRFGHFTLLWAFFVLDVAALLFTYVAGSLEIHYWLRTSVSRVMVLPRLILLAELGVWTLLAAEVARQPALLDPARRSKTAASPLG